MYIKDILDQDVKYYKCDRVSIEDAPGGLDVYVYYHPNNSLFEIDNPTAGSLPDIVVILNVVCYIGSIHVPHMKCTPNGIPSRSISIDRLAEASFICEARDILEVILDNVGEEIYVLDRVLL